MRQEQLFFSIIIPTYARPGQLAACLQSLAHLDYPHDCFEVIVVDDGSETLPEDVVASFRDQLDLTMLTQTHAGPAVARNTGAAQARGEFLAFTDDDCAPASNWLQVLGAHLIKEPDCAIGGRTLNAFPANRYSAATQFMIDYLYSYYNPDPNQSRFFASNNLALPADRFHTIGGFKEMLPYAAGEDREFCDRWLRHGYRMAYVPKATVYHAHELTFRTFWRQHFGYGRGAFQFRQARACRDQERIRVEPLSFYLNLLRYPFSQAHGWRALSLAVLLVMSQVANAVGFMWERAKAQ